MDGVCSILETENAGHKNVEDEGISTVSDSLNSVMFKFDSTIFEVRRV